MIHSIKWEILNQSILLVEPVLVWHCTSPGQGMFLESVFSKGVFSKGVFSTGELTVRHCYFPVCIRPYQKTHCTKRIYKSIFAFEKTFTRKSNPCSNALQTTHTTSSAWWHQQQRTHFICMRLTMIASTTLRATYTAAAVAKLPAKAPVPAAVRQRWKKANLANGWGAERNQTLRGWSIENLILNTRKNIKLLTT